MSRTRDLDRRRFLLGGLACGAALGLPRRALASADRLLLLYWVQGGWDVSFCFDPHFESGALDRDPDSAPATAGGIAFADAPSRPSVRRFFEAHGDRTVVVNGMAVGSISHAQCSRLVLTGSRREDAADLPTRLAAGAAGRYPLPSLVLSGPRFPGTLGAWTAPLNPTLTGTLLGELPRGATAHDPATEARIRAYLAEEAQALSGGPALQTYRDGLDRLDTLTEGAPAIHVMEYATDEDLLEAGLSALSEGISRCVTVGGSLPFMSQWDSHTSNRFLQDQNYEHLFDELSGLMGRLAALPAPGGGALSEVTTVLVMSEMGRTPVENSSQGKDHWPYTSLMIVGPGVAGGRVLGATNEALVGQPVALSTGEASAAGEVLTPAHLAAGLLQHHGVDPEAHFPGVTPFLAPYS